MLLLRRHAYLFAAAGGVVSERVGVIGLTLEGFMLTGAFCTALGSYYSGSPWVGLLCGAAGGMLAALVYFLLPIFWLKYLDKLFVRSPNAHRIAGMLCAVAVK